MTKRRDPGSIKYAVAHCIGVLGSEIAAVTGKSERLIYMYSDPDEEGRHIPFKDAIALDLAMRAAGHGSPFHDLHAELLNQTPSARAGSCAMKAFLDIAEKIGPLAATVSNAVSDGQIDLHERREITEAGYDLIAQVRALLDTVTPPAPAAVEVPHKGAVR